MKKFLLAGLLATTIASPITSAMAQDRGGPSRGWQRGNDGQRGDGGQRGQRAVGGWNGGGQQPQFQRQRNDNDQARAQAQAQQAQARAQQAQIQAQQAQAQAQARAQQQAQQNQRRGNDGRFDGNRFNRDQARPATPQIQVRPDGRNQESWRGQDRNDRRNDGRNDWNRNNQNWNGQNWNGRPDQNRGNRNWNDGRRLNDRDRWNDQRRWNNGWRNDSRYDWQRYRNSNRSLFRAPRYYAPYGWNYGYQRFSVGFFLNDLLFTNQYWINDPFYYRLPPVYGTLRWVRYYDDALLIDIRDGYVVDVIHDFFW